MSNLTKIPPGYKEINGLIFNAFAFRVAKAHIMSFGHYEFKRLDLVDVMCTAINS